MTKLADIAAKVRSKNAGPFWLTLDIFCDTPEIFARTCGALTSERVAAAFRMDAEDLKRFEIADLNVLKFSLPRPEVQGTRSDRDMHGASFANLLAEMDIA